MTRVCPFPTHYPLEQAANSPPSSVSGPPFASTGATWCCATRQRHVASHVNSCNHDRLSRSLLLVRCVPYLRCQHTAGATRFAQILRIPAFIMSIAYNMLTAAGSTREGDSLFDHVVDFFRLSPSL